MACSVDRYYYRLIKEIEILTNNPFSMIDKKLLDYFDGDEMSSNVWLSKYAMKDVSGNRIENTPDDMHKRMAKYFAEVEERYEFREKENVKLKLSNYGYHREQLTEDKIYNLFKNFKYVVPGGSVMSGLGSPMPVSLSNCWVIAGPNDSLDDIFRVCNEQSQLFKRRGGVGFDISKLRPNGSLVHNSAKTTTGPVSFMGLFSDVTNTIGQSGRRGALMISMHIDHPDAEEFIEKKQDLTKVTGANVSVQIGDDFMNAVINDEDYIQHWPIDCNYFERVDNEDYDVLYQTSDTNGNICYYKKVKAKKVWDKLVHCAWNTAEPGILFKDRHYNYSPDGVYPQFRGTSTNPCGEIFMHEDSCRLIHVNLSSFITDPFTDKARLDDDKLYEVFYETTRLGDDLVDLEADAIKRILNKIESDGDKDGNEYKLYDRLLTNTLRGRRCGVGFFGLSDAIAKLGYKFDSEEGMKAIKHMMKVMFAAELDSETDMAITRGAFTDFNRSVEDNANGWYQMVSHEFPNVYKKMMLNGRRNVSFGTAAPTGSVAMLSHCSSGIEPIFMPYYTRRVKCTTKSDRVDFVDRDGEKFTEYVTVHPTLKEWAEFKYGEDTSKWNEKKWEEAYKKSPWYGSTANDIDWIKRVEIQSIVQHYISHSISSTLNLPNNINESKVSEIYMESWKKGLKGVTVYRDGCRSGVIVSTKKGDETMHKICAENEPKRRPKTLDAKIIRFSNKGEKWVGIVGMLDGKPYELFTGLLEKLNIPQWVETGTIIKNHEDVVDEQTGETKRISRYDLCYKDSDGFCVCIDGISRIFNPEFWNYGKLISGLLRHNMPITYIVKVIKSLKLDESSINTWKNGVVRALNKFEGEVSIDEKCPECGGRLVRENGCIRCIDCGYSKCS